MFNHKKIDSQTFFQQDVEVTFKDRFSNFFQQVIEVIFDSYLQATSEKHVDTLLYKNAQGRF